MKKAALLWLLQRVTAVLIFIVLGVHVYRVHYVELGQPILFAGIAIRLKSLLMLVIDSSLLFFGLFHGLNGLRTVLLDYDFFDRQEKLLSWVLSIIGIIFFILGVKGLWAFIIR
ncbi:hypothetical protein HZB07_00225 [Candidatus Saganbacteria bacterium]|nr:hypothetical protein [Candidatus Saganbacteria bacterium]